MLIILLINSKKKHPDESRCFAKYQTNIIYVFVDNQYKFRRL
jgi:hypothetical protein